MMIFIALFIALIVFSIWVFKGLQLEQNRKAEWCPSCRERFFGRYPLVNCCDHKYLEKFTAVANG